MPRRIAIVGFGEAGSFLGRAFAEVTACEVRAYDILIDDPVAKMPLKARAREAGVLLCQSSREAVDRAELILSLVTPDQAISAAVTAAEALGPGQTFLDLNSALPRDKKEAAQRIQQAGAAYVDGVAMDTIQRCGLKVPILLSGPRVAALAKTLNDLGWNAEAISDEVGAASTVKMLRSVVIKGIEALLAESLFAASKLGEVDRILKSLNHTYPGLDWFETARYHIERMARHGARRSEELKAAAETLSSLGVEPLMARAVAARQAWSAELGLAEELGSRPNPSLQSLLTMIGQAQDRQPVPGPTRPNLKEAPNA